jgi:hypothetical protein
VERVAFLIEETNERLGCLLNPETLVMRRVAGVQPRRSATGRLTGTGLADDPLLYTGGGRTELELDLLFDVSLAGSSITTNDVRDLTLPLWNLAENSGRDAGYARPPLVLFIWGKSWNIRGVIVAVAERLEYFTPEGVPRRSWLRLRMLRAAESRAEAASTGPAPPSIPPVEELRVPEGSVEVHEVIGGGAPSPLPGPAGGLPDGVMTPSDIIAAALAETHAARWLSSAYDGIASAAQSIRSDLAEWMASEVGEPAAEVAQAVEAEVEAIFSALGSVASAAHTELVGTVIDAAATVRSAARRIGSQVEGLASEAGQFLAGRVDAALERIEPAVESMLSAARTVTAAVKTRAASLIAGAVEEMEYAAAAIETGLQPLVEAVSEVGGEAVGRIRGAVERIDTVVGRIRETGQTVAREMVPGALAAIASDVEVLWAVGEFAAAHTVGRAVERLAFAFKNVTSATEAIAAVVKRRAATVASSAVQTASTALGRLRAQEDPAAVEAVREAVARIVAAVSATRPASEAEARAMEPVPEAVETLQAAAERLDTVERAEAAEEAQAAMETVAGALEEAAAAEEETTAELVRATVEAEQPAVPPAPPPEAVPAEEEAPPPEEVPEAVPPEEGVTPPEAIPEPAPPKEDVVPPAVMPEAALPEEEAPPPEAAPTAALPEEVVTPPEVVPAVPPAEEEVPPPRPARRLLPPPRTEPEPARARVGFGERLDVLAFRYYRDPALWRLLAVFNDVDHPLTLAPGRLLRVPPASALEGT